MTDIDASRITIAPMITAQEVYDCADDIATVARAYGRGGPDKPDFYYREFIHWLATVPEILTMIYVDGLPAAWVRIDSHRDNPVEVGRKVLEFSGAILPEYQGQGLTEAIAPLVIDAAIARTGRRKVIATLQDANPQAVAALARIGFEYRDTDATGRRIYRHKAERDQNAQARQ